MNTAIRQVPHLTADAARRVVDAAAAAAEAAGERSAVAVVDASGRLCAFLRMDGAAPQATQVAQDKAYTAVGFGMPTDRWPDLLQQDGPLAAGAPAGIDRFVPFGGGVPLTVDGQVVGAVGVSGGHWSADARVAEAGAAALG